MITMIFQINNNQTGFDSTSFRPKHTKRQRSMRSGEICMFDSTSFRPKHTKRQRSMRSGEICMFDSSPFAQVSVETRFIPWLDCLRRFYLRYGRTGRTLRHAQGKLCQDRRREVESPTRFLTGGMWFNVCNVKKAALQTPNHLPPVKKRVAVQPPLGGCFHPKR